MYRTTALINFMTFYWTMLVCPHFFNNLCFMYARSSISYWKSVDTNSFRGVQVSLHNADLRALYDIFQFMPICVHSLYNPFKNNPSVHGYKRLFVYTWLNTDLRVLWYSYKKRCAWQRIQCRFVCIHCIVEGHYMPGFLFHLLIAFYHVFPKHFILA